MSAERNLLLFSLDLSVRLSQTKNVCPGGITVTALTAILRTHGALCLATILIVFTCVCVSGPFILQLLKGSAPSKPPCLRILRHSTVCACIGGWTWLSPSRRRAVGLRWLFSGWVAFRSGKQLCRLMWEQTVAPMGENKVSTGCPSKTTSVYCTGTTNVQPSHWNTGSEFCSVSYGLVLLGKAPP